MKKKIVIIGGVAGGASAAARLRRLDEQAEIVLLERGEHISFANCGLPYYIGGEIAHREQLLLQTPESFHTRFCVDVRVRSEAVALDRKNRIVTVRGPDAKEYPLSYDALILSMGAMPLYPPIPGLESSRVFPLRSLSDAFRVKDFLKREKPASAVVLGGGYVGVEMAENLWRQGVAVTLLEGAAQIIAPLDPDMACELHRHIEQKGVRLLLGNAVTAVEETPDGLCVCVGKERIFAQMLVLAAGVRPESALAQAAGIACNARGGIVTDAQMRTSDPAIYAVGDVAEISDFVTEERGMIPLAGPANRQGRIAADNICGIASRYTGTQGSAVLRVFDMTAAATGVNEKTAKRLGLAYEKSFTYSQSHAGYFPGGSGLSIKLLWNPKDGKLLGGQVTGFDGVDKRCDVLATALRLGATVRELSSLELCYAPPYSSAKDPVNLAGFVAENLIDGHVRQFHWHDVEAALRDPNNMLLDVRTQGEFRRGHIAGSHNIPLDALRERLEELDSKKQIYVTCQVGQRGYFACRILSQNGFSCLNLSGGYRLYEAMERDQKALCAGEEQQ